MEFQTLLPPLAAHHNGGQRPRRLIDTDEPGNACFQVEATRWSDMAHEASDVLQVRVWMRDAKWIMLGLTDRGELAAMCWAPTEAEAAELWSGQLVPKGYELSEPYNLKPPKDAHGGPRRSARLLDDDDPDRAGQQVSAKLVECNDGETLLQVRIWMSVHGWTQIVLSERADLAAFTTGTHEKESWKAAQATLRRRGYDL